MGFREYLIETADPEDLIIGKGALARYIARQTSIDDIGFDVKQPHSDGRTNDVNERSIHVG